MGSRGATVILDCYGVPIQTVYVRRPLGFVTQPVVPVREDENEPPNISGPDRNASGCRWITITHREEEL